MEQKIADALHQILCRWNHTNGCSWHYESWDHVRSLGARSSYLEKARELLTRTGASSEAGEQVVLQVLESVLHVR